MTGHSPPSVQSSEVTALPGGLCLVCREAGRQAQGSSTARPVVLSTAKQQPEQYRGRVHSRPGLPAARAGGPGSGLALGVVAALMDGTSSRQGLAEYCTLIDSSSSFRAYRAALSEVEPPCIPYL